jgi:hypothetical protein
MLAKEARVDELPRGVNERALDERRQCLLPLAREAAGWVIACEARWAREDFGADAEPTEMRATVARVLASIEGTHSSIDADELAARLREVSDQLDPLVPEVDPGGDDPWMTLDAGDFRGAVGLAVLSWALTALAGEGRDDEREWIETLLADPRWNDDCA